MGGFLQAFMAGQQMRRQRRMDQLQEELGRGRMALQNAAGARQDQMLRDREENAKYLRERLDYQDRMKVLGGDTQPFTSLLKTLPEADASTDVGRAFALNDRIARHPETADTRPPLVDPGTGQMMGPYQEGSQPTPREERQIAVDSAYSAFGGAAKARQKALEQLKLRLAKPPKPFTNDLDIARRGVEQKKRQAQQMIAGQETLPNGMVMDITDPGRRENVKRQGQAMLAQAIAEEQSLGSAYQQRAGVQPAPVMGPQAMYQQLQNQETPEDEIQRILGGMFSDAELQAAGFDLTE